MFAATPIYKPLLLGLILLSSTSCSYLCDCKSDDKSGQDTVAGSDESVFVDNNAASSDQRTTMTSGSLAPVATSGTNPVNSGTSVSVTNKAPTPPAAAPVVGTDPVSSNSGATAPQATARQNYAAANASSGDDRKQRHCPDPSINEYKKSVAFTSFPRKVPSTGNLGGLQHVEQQLPELLGGNLHNRHSMLALTYLQGGLQNANVRGEINAATQAQALSKQHRVQFIVSGEVDDMTLRHPDSVSNPGLYTRFMNGTHDLLHINTPLDKRYRAFNFKVEVRDGFTGHIVFTNHYHTFGKWKVEPNAQVGFGSPEFWETDYGSQVQQLIALASDEMAGTINCQPYIARIDAAPGQQQIVIHSGNSNGLHSGDTLDLYQLVYQPITGEYQRSDTRLVKRAGRVQLIETYPSHSIGNVIDETLLGGQYVVKAR